MLYFDQTPDEVLAGLMKQQATPEELHPELKAAIMTSSFGTPMVHHKYVISVFYTPAENHRLNMVYNATLHEAAQALKAGDYEGYVFLHERPYRLQAFLAVLQKLDDGTYWNLLRKVWVDTESPHINIAVWKRLFSNKRRKLKHLLIDESDRKVYGQLPDVLTIYRGVQQDGPDTGISWTLSEEKALFFAGRFWSSKGKKTGRVLSKQICKSEAIAYFNTRSEQEIIHW